MIDEKSMPSLPAGAMPPQSPPPYPAPLSKDAPPAGPYSAAPGSYPAPGGFPPGGAPQPGSPGQPGMPQPAGMPGYPSQAPGVAGYPGQAPGAGGYPGQAQGAYVQPQATGGQMQPQYTGFVQPQATGMQPGLQPTMQYQSTSISSRLPTISGLPSVSGFGNNQYATGANLGTDFQNQLYARCARGEHDVVVKYGPCGIITAIACFPIGLIALLIDKEEKCIRCGQRVGGATI